MHKQTGTSPDIACAQLFQHIYAATLVQFLRDTLALAPWTSDSLREAFIHAISTVRVDHERNSIAVVMAHDARSLITVAEAQKGSERRACRACGAALTTGAAGRWYPGGNSRILGILDIAPAWKQTLLRA